MSQQKVSSRASVRLTTKKAYSTTNGQQQRCFRKYFAVDACTGARYASNQLQDNDESLLTSKDRKSMFERLVKSFQKAMSKDQEISPWYMLMALFIENGQLYSEMMEKVRIHSSSGQPRQDLEFYIPQLCTYLVFHEQLHNRQLINMMERASKLDLHFAHRFSLYLDSLVIGGLSEEVVRDYLKRLFSLMAQKWRLSINWQPTIDKQQLRIIEAYNNRSLRQEEFQRLPKIPSLEVNNLYHSLYEQTNHEQNLFQPTIDYLKDLVTLANNLHNKPNKRQFLMTQLKKMNESLPARISLPLYRHSIREKTVLGILYEESKLFQTKQRTSYSLLVEVFQEENFQKGLARGNFGETTRRIRTATQENFGTILQLDIVTPREDHTEKLTKSQLIGEQKPKTDDKIREQPSKLQALNRFFKLRKKNNKQLVEEKKPEDSRQHLEEKHMSNVFPQSSDERRERVCRYSPYAELPGYEIVHLIVKADDDLKQEQFAMQLIQMFKGIFETERLPLQLYAYQIVSVSSRSGVIQYMEDCITIDELKRRDSNLSEVVQGKDRLKKFVRSLAAYSIVTYLLQVKDRHNGNIMICRDGSIRHIDYGFFISNSPGKGVEIERNVPFKLPAEYVQVMGGPTSKIFQQFRLLFYQGFNAARKHQDRLRILINLMYSSHGTTMPCFARGEEGLQQLQERFNPPGIRTDVELNIFCQNLINSSIDNWRARWYDKYQYYAQGILY